MRNFRMKDLLKKAVEACVNEDFEAAKTFYKEYFHLKSKSILESMEKGVVEGECGECGEESTTTHRILTHNKWECGKCGSHKFEAKTPEQKADAKSQTIERKAA
jgi:ribosomal protein L37AE/L43A